MIKIFKFYLNACISEKCRHLILLLLQLYGFSSCSPILALFYGIKQPHSESEHEQIRYLQRYHIDTSNLLILKYQFIDSLRNGLYDITPTINKKKGGTFSLVQFRMFDDKGKFISGWAICIGSSKYLHLYDSFPPFKSQYIDGKINLKTDLTMYSSLKGQNITSEKIIANHKYVIIAYWAKYLGRPAREMLRSIEDYIKKKSEYDIILYKVNLGDLNRK